MYSVTSLCTFLVLGCLSLLIMAAPAESASSCCPSKFIINATTPAGVQTRYLYGQFWCRRPGTAECSVAHWAYEESIDGAPRLFLKDGGLYMVNANPPRRLYIDIDGSGADLKNLYWKNVTDPSLKTDVDGFKYRPLEAKMNAKTCLLDIDFKKFQHHGGTTNGFRRVDWVMSDKPIANTTQQFPFLKLKAIP